MCCLLRVLVPAVLVAACAGPAPSGSLSPASADAGPTNAAVESPIPAPSVPLRTSQPTIEPEPTLDGQAPPRSGIEINPNIVDRRGVPESLRTNYWWGTSDVGLLGTTAQLGLPSGERILHAADGLVVSTRSQPPGPVALVVREFTTGSILREIEVDVVGVDAKIVGRRVFWSGQLGECNDTRLDGGVWAADVDTAADPVAIVKPGETIGCEISGRQLKLSPSGRTLGAVMSSYGELNWVDVVDVATLTRTRRIDDVWPWALTDDTFLQWDHKFTDALTSGMGGITAYDLTTGFVRWGFPQPGNLEKFSPWVLSAIGADFAVEYIWTPSPTETQYILATIAPRTGDRNQLLTQTDTASPDDLADLVPELSSSSHLVLRKGYSSQVGGPTPYSVVDVATGSVTWNAFVIDPPWLCNEEFCVRD